MHSLVRLDLSFPHKLLPVLALYYVGAISFQQDCNNKTFEWSRKLLRKLNEKKKSNRKLLKHVEICFLLSIEIVDIDID